MRRLGTGVLALSASLALLSSGCDTGGVTGAGGFCDPDVLVPAGTSGAFRQYQKDLDRCRAGSLFRRAELGVESDTVGDGGNSR